VVDLLAVLQRAGMCVPGPKAPLEVEKVAVGVGVLEPAAVASTAPVSWRQVGACCHPTGLYRGNALAGCTTLRASAGTYQNRQLAVGTGSTRQMDGPLCSLEPILCQYATRSPHCRLAAAP
jgi:hypothetical protein